MLPDKKVCQICKQENKKSQIAIATEQDKAIDFLPYYDEEGNMHCHNPNYVYQIYKCTHGHIEEEKYLVPCWCGWGKNATS